MRLTPPTQESFWTAVTFAICGAASLSFPHPFFALTFFAVSALILICAAMFNNT